MGSLAKVFWGAEIEQKIRGHLEKHVLLLRERDQNFCGKFAEVLRNVQTNFCNDPFPNDPISESLRKFIFKKASSFDQLSV